MYYKLYIKVYSLYPVTELEKPVDVHILFLALFKTFKISKKVSWTFSEFEEKSN